MNSDLGTGRPAVADAEGRDARFSRTDDGYEDPTDGERHEYDDVPPRCKVEGCDTPALIQKGPYGRLCAEHKEAKKRSLTKRKSRPKLIRASEIKPKSAPESTFVQLARRIELVKEQIAEMEAGLKELVDELVEAAHTRSTA